MHLNSRARSYDVGAIIDDLQTSAAGIPAARSADGGAKSAHNRRFQLTEEQLSTHIAIIGPTGQGKSRLQWQLLREHRRQRKGFCLIDTGDLAKDFLADCAAEVFKNRNYGLLSKLHYVKLGYGKVARYDAFGFQMPEDISSTLSHGAFVCWQHTRVQSLIRVFQANTTGSTDFLQQPRAHRVLTNVFNALSVEVQNRRLAIEDVFIFFDPSHKAHARVLDRIAPMLPSEIRAEMEQIGGFKRLEDLRREVESSVNRLRMVLGPCLKAMLASTGGESCLDMKAIIDQGGYLIVDAQGDDFVGYDQNVALASLMGLDYVEEHLRRPKRCRRSSTLFVDETPELLGPLGREIGRWLRVLRKYGLTCCLSFQDLECMRRDDFDLAPTVLSQCGTIFCFRTRWPSDSEILGRVLLRGNLDFSPLVHEVERHPGHQFLQIDEVSESMNQDVGKSASAAKTKTNTTNTAQTHSHATGNNASAGRNATIVNGPDGHLVSLATGDNATGGVNASDALAVTFGSAQASGMTNTSSTSEKTGWAVSISHKVVPLPVVVRELQETGQLRRSISDQQAEHEALLHGLERRQVVAIAPGMKKAVVLETVEVNDPFVSATAQESAVTHLVSLLHQRHDYFYQPTFDETEQGERVKRFLSDDAETEEHTDAPADRSARTNLKTPVEKEPFCD